MEDLRSNNTILDEYELEAIKINQEIIKRMSDNSQKIKNFFMVLSGLLITLFSNNNNNSNKIIIIYIIIGLVFWFMDANYLKLERQFRMHHQAILNGSISYIEKYNFNPNKYKYSILKTMFNSFSILIYPCIIVFVSIIYLI